MKVVFLTDYTAGRYIDGSDPANALVRFAALPPLDFRKGDIAEVSNASNHDGSVTMVIDNADGRYMIEPSVTAAYVEQDATVQPVNPPVEQAAATADTPEQPAPVAEPFDPVPILIGIAAITGLYLIFR